MLRFAAGLNTTDLVVLAGDGKRVANRRSIRRQFENQDREVFHGYGTQNAA
jgi:hypothetical protein